MNMSADQVVGSAVDLLNQERIIELNKEMTRIFANETSAISQQDLSFIEAMKQVDKVRNFLNTPEHILGSDLTKHGEIAEQIEVNIRNARDLIEGRIPAATFDGVGRTAPEDYLIDGIKVQSKFINGVNNNLEHVIEHMGKYQDFGRDGSFYQIPKDSYETIQQVLNGHPPAELSSRTANKIIEKVAEIERETGQTFSEVVKPSLSDYSEVQQGTAAETLSKHERDLSARNEEIVEDTHAKADKSREQAQLRAEPSLQEGIKAGVMGAAISGGIHIALYIYQKQKEGKSVFQYDEKDWRELGIDFAKGGMRGGVTGFSIYSLTNFINMSAPLASAFVSASFGVAKLVADLSNSKISTGEFIVQGQITCMEAGMVALGAASGQVLIPIPILGTLVGSFATSTLMSLTKKYLSDQDNEVHAKLIEIYHEAIHKIDHEYQNIVESILEEYQKLGTMAEMAFDFDSNAVLRFYHSQVLATAYGVPEGKILKGINEIDDFFMK